MRMSMSIGGGEGVPMVRLERRVEGRKIEERVVMI